MIRRKGLTDSEAIEVLNKRDIHQREMEDLIVGLTTVQIEFYVLSEPLLLARIAEPAP